MARKNGLKNDSPSITFNTRTKAVMADAVQDNIKEKVSAVREVVFGKSNNEIVLVLQYYDYDVEKTIQAYVEDGAKSALTEWHYSGTKPVKKKKNKKKVVPPAQDTPKSPPSVSSEAESTASLLLNGEIREPMVNGHLEIRTDISPTVLNNGPISPELSYEAASSCSNNNNNNNNDFSFNNNNNANFTNANLTSACVIMNGDSEPVTTSTATATTVPKETSPDPLPQRSQQTHRQRNYSGSHGHMQGHGHSQGHGHPHGHNERNRTTSASSTASGDVKPAGKRPAHCLDRSVKDLHRQTVSLERLRLVFNEEVEKAYKRIKSVFDEIRTCLNAREGELVREMDGVRDTGRETFGMRQSRAADLKMKIDRADRLSETELAELRTDIKLFVSDRKLDEDLARAVRFLYDSDFLESEIKKFGEAVPAKCSYAQRRPSASSIASSGAVSEPDPHTETLSIAASQRAGTADKSEKSDIPHLGPAEAHELAELQRRLKHSLTLEGIPVETFPDRPASAPVPDTTTDTARPQRPDSAYPRRNQNRRYPRDEDRRDRPRDAPRDKDRRDRPRDAPRDKDGRPPFPQGGFSGERVVLIGKSTRPQSGPGRRGRGGGWGRGGYSATTGNSAMAANEMSSQERSTSGNSSNATSQEPDAVVSPSKQNDPASPSGAGTGSPRRRNPGNRSGNQGNRPGNQGNRPGNQGNRPGEQGNRPGDQGNRPGDQGNRPSNPGNRPGNQGNRPGEQGNRSGNPGNRPGNQGNRPGEQGNRPDDQGNRPGNPGNRPGEQGNRPGEQGNRPGNPGNRPGEQGNRPGEQGNRPGDQGNRPGEQGNQPGDQGNRPDDQGNRGGNRGGSQSGADGRQNETVGQSKSSLLSSQPQPTAGP